MDNLDEQLDKATASNAELQTQLSDAQSQITQLQASNTQLEAANSELRESLAHTKDELSAKETAHRATLEENNKLKAEAKTAEERAAEIYGARASEPAEVTAKGDPKPPIAEQFAAISDPTKQTEFLRSLNEEQKAQLYSTI